MFDLGGVGEGVLEWRLVWQDEGKCSSRISTRIVSGDAEQQS